MDLARLLTGICGCSDGAGRLCAPCITDDAVLPCRPQVQIFDAAGSDAGQLRSEHMTAIPTRLCVHAVAGLVAGATSSGRVHVYRMLQ
jgi:hypothetical protein